jgi:alpha-tubulin suppressor-like RCC1 family protein
MDAGVSAVAAGRAHTCAIQSGALYCWGANDSGQLGDNTNSSSNVPNPVTGMGAGVTAVAAGSAHTCAVQRGLLSCWGDNMSGQLGDGTTTARNTPAQLRSL